MPWQLQTVEAPPFGWISPEYTYYPSYTEIVVLAQKCSECYKRFVWMTNKRINYFFMLIKDVRAYCTVQISGHR